MRQVAAERYEIRRMLGQGGMGTVYAAFDRRRQIPVALKVLRDPSRDSPFRLKREFRSMVFFRHPNLVRLYDLGAADDGSPFFTMELVTGLDLKRMWADTASGDTALAGEAVSSERPVPASTAALLTGVVDGLSFLHRSGKVHRDLKPSNILVGEDGRPRLVDFGLLLDLEDPRGRTVGGIAGTPEYMAPEQVEQREITPAADLYALGCILYESLTGVTPFSGTGRNILLHKLDHSPSFPTAYGPREPQLEELCLSLLSRDPARRPPCEHVREVLCLVAGRTPPVPEVPAAPPPIRLVGRDREATRIEAALERARSEPRLVVLEGESGVGKTALAAEIAGRVQARGQEVWFGSCHAHEQVPYKAFDAIVDTAVAVLLRRRSEAARLLPTGAEALARLFPVLRELDVLAERSGDEKSSEPARERARAFRALCALLTNLSGGQPPLIILDDLQRADAESLDVLTWMASEGEVPGMLIVATRRADEVPPDHRLRRLLVQPRVERVPLGPLDAAAVAEIVRGASPSPPDGEHLARIVAEAHGNAFLAIELARALEQLGEGQLPSLEELVRTRLGTLAEVPRKVLNAATVVAGRAGFSLLAAVGGVGAAELADALDELLRLHLVHESPDALREDGYQVAHDRIQAAAYALLATGERKRLHAAAAEFLVGAGEAARAVAHWRLAGEEERARRAALEAAELAERQLAFDRAAELYALGASSGGAGGPLQRRLAEALSRAGRHAEAAAAWERAARDAPASSARELLLAGATARLAAGDVAGGLAAIAGLLGKQRLLRQSRLAALSLALWRVASETVSWWVFDASRGRRLDLDEPAADDFRLRLLHTAHHHISPYLPIYSVRFGLTHARLSRRQRLRPHLGRSRLGHAFTLFGILGRSGAGAARRHVDRGESLCAEASDHQGLLEAQVVRAYGALLEERWELVRQAVREGEALAARARLHGDPLLIQLRTLAVAGELYAGNLPAALREGEAHLSRARTRGNRQELAWLMAMVGYGHLWRGDTESGSSLFEEAQGLMPDSPLTTVRLQVDVLALTTALLREDARGVWERLHAIERRWRESGLITTPMEIALFRMQRARTRLLLRRQGQVAGASFGCWRDLVLAPMPSSLAQEALRLRAAAAFLDGRPRPALRLLDRAVRDSERSELKVGLYACLMARSIVRKQLGVAGAAFDRARADEGFAALGTSVPAMLALEGWGA